MRFYVSPDSVYLDRHLIEVKDSSELHHIRDVMRLKPDDNVTVFDGKGREYSGEIDTIDRHTAVINIKKVTEVKKDKSPYVILFQAIPKKNKMDFIVEKSVELGVSVVVPIVTERTIPVVTEKACNKLERWRRISRAASKQCGRTELPLISDILDFEKAIAKAKENDLVIFPAIVTGSDSLKEIVNKKRTADNRIAVFVGPEGDFSHTEIEIAKKNGFSVCSLGSRVLRVETAALYVLSCLNYEN